VDQTDSHALTAILLDLYTRHVVRRESTVPTEAEISRFSRAAANESFYAVLASVAALRAPLEGSSAETV